MSHRRLVGWSALLAVWLIPVAFSGCSKDPAQDPAQTDPAEPLGLAEETLAADADRDYFVFPTGRFEVPAGEEKFFCYTMTLEEDLLVDRFVYASQPVVHHLVVAETMSPEPEGFSECDVLFRPSWIPIFLAGTGDSVVDPPEGAAFKFRKGSQVLLQLHLLNPTREDIEDQVSVHLRKDEAETAEDVGMVAFGSMAVDLPPNAQSEVVGACEVEEDMEIFAVFAHMHYLGISLKLETGPTADTMEEVYLRDPWDFDYQSIEPFRLTLAAGDHARVTCSYDNPNDERVGFGESSLDEMCFLIAYVTGADQHIGGCLGGGGSAAGSFLPDGCGEDPPNEAGIGAPCTEGNGECSDGLACTHDLIDPAGPGFCLSLGACETSSDCGGGGAVCCKPTALSIDINLCLPASCVFNGCDAL